jgi:hypothetical protein
MCHELWLDNNKYGTYGTVSSKNEIIPTELLRTMDMIINIPR